MTIMEKNSETLMNPKEVIARRVALEIKEGQLVNLGIGLPSMVANFLPESVHVFFQAENGVIGLGSRPPEGMEDPNLTDAGGGFVTAVPGAASIDSAMSFGLIRGGHLDMTVLGGSRSTREAISPTGWFRARWFRAWAERWILLPERRTSLSLWFTAPRVARKSFLNAPCPLPRRGVSR